MQTEAGVDLVSIQPVPLCYSNNVVVMLTIIFSAQFPLEKEGGFVSKQGQPHPHVHPKAGILTAAHNCKMVYSKWKRKERIISEFEMNFVRVLI